MNSSEKHNMVSQLLCASTTVESCDLFENGKCLKHGKCRICEKTDKQIDYILSSIEKCTYLKACAGSGKTEVLSMKAAYEISRWSNHNTGIAILTFTNEATNTIKERISQLYPKPLTTFNFIGTFDSFIHGYISQKFGCMFYRKGTKEKDKSFSIVSSDIKSYDNGWLTNFKIDKFPTKWNIYANQIEYCGSEKKWYISLGNKNKKSIFEYYNLPNMQEKINELRKKYNNDNLYKYNYFKERVVECKRNFWKSGFSTFEDMKLIAFQCLKKEDEIAKIISKKFPLIMIDECQDLSYIDLQIVNLLRMSGSVIHFIGDLNQAIYSFKDAQPQHLEDLLSFNEFNFFELKDNFRSHQNIVDVACNLNGITSNIIGHASNIYDGYPAIYYEYENEATSAQKFQEILKHYKIPETKSIVLTRSTRLKRELLNGINIDYKEHAIINALQLWKTKSPETKKIALQLLGFCIQKWTKGLGREDNYYCPENIFPDIFRWRLMLRDILNELTSIDIINNFEGKTYSNWYRSAQADIVSCIDYYIKELCKCSLIVPTDIKMRAPQGTASKFITQLNNKDNSEILNVNTIHAVKGCTYDAVLLVSSANAKGTGYWEKWIDDKDETTRFAYVASTRPKFLLCWGVPNLNDEQREKIESIGLKKYVI